MLLRADLVAHDLERALAGPDEDDAGVGAGAREGGVLGEEAVARVDRLRAGLARGGEDRLDVEVRLRAAAAGPMRTATSASRTCGRIGVGVAVDGDRADAEAPERPDDAARDLAAIGDEHGVERRLGAA